MREDNQIRNSKFEIRNKSKIPNSTDRNVVAGSGFRFEFGILSLRICFGFGIWCLGFLAAASLFCGAARAVPQKGKAAVRNPKHQIPNPKQMRRLKTPNPKRNPLPAAAFRSFEFGIWDLFGI